MDRFTRVLMGAAHHYHNGEINRSSLLRIEVSRRRTVRWDP